ncbi:tetratricopeptide repeat protein [Pseudomonas sp. M30-35]|uniref:tetratricopeptide repeat protein n=1 Tax=Pseudomonas sp. M30-35 TaxID=1981174 RepID=UPI000B3C095F|nr:tetratricopeptide repeat protein [Pseudomonas sp. M30-35]ARU89769.1 hypothetical protein B9K09_18120 [Pseudomonas sp. M30-35]
MSFVLRKTETLSAANAHENPRRTAQWLLNCAGLGELEAQALLGQILLDGQGIERDTALARRWFSIAAERGHSMARNMLGRCHEHGWGGPIDLHSALNCYQLAAAQGLDWAMYNLANLLATGRAGTLDLPQAFVWYQRAAELGHAKSMNLLGRFYEEGTVVAAEPKLALEWFRRSAEGGDFRGQFSYAGRLLELGEISSARFWLEKALAIGNLNFIHSACRSLAALNHPELLDINAAYAQRQVALANEHSV